MKLINEFEPIRDWADERNIYTEGTVLGQLRKVQEEVLEISVALTNKDEDGFKDGIGDAIISLVNLAKIKGYNAEDCVNSAYNEIKDREGFMIDGEFVKNV
jgi:hypothetical protein